MTRDELKEKADALGFDYPSNMPTSKLEELVSNSALEEETNEDNTLVEEEAKVALEVKSETETVVAEVVADYYENHPKRLLKLRGLLSRTHDEDERYKIKGMIRKLS